MHAPLPQALRAIALTLASLAACGAGMAAEAVAIAKANTASISPLARSSVPASAEHSMAATLTRAEAEQRGMGYPSFEAVMTEALGTPTAAGYVIPAQRGAVEAVIARTMGGMMP